MSLVRGVFLEEATDLQAADARQHQIQDHEANRILLNRVQGLFSVFGRHDRKTGLF